MDDGFGHSVRLVIYVDIVYDEKYRTKNVTYLKIAHVFGHFNGRFGVQKREAVCFNARHVVLPYQGVKVTRCQTNNFLKTKCVQFLQTFLFHQIHSPHEIFKILLVTMTPLFSHTVCSDTFFLLALTICHINTTTNTIIIIQIRRAQIISVGLRQNTRKSSQLQNPKPKKPERLQFSNHSALTLTMIVLIYLVCNLPRLALNLLEYTLLSEIYMFDECGCLLIHWWISSLIRISHFLLAINSSVNFLIYFSSSKPFKKLLEIKV